ncbi:universal stress protein [Sulfurisoma sediminicola]|uniref:Nucleotide-binding universal stress UspA family protein n=1 Tax=Sulfurisoma sediminicola TaxID=1381557 RepID=A0A497XJC4_9PROT|nr:universal stress protein [Sulfurisoma sediminicola]RLJ68042.1 nucleotide-binding universal stress UspA family protein [Sulfurisoma sediminicola]
MKTPLKLLLCHHGTAGANRAEALAHELTVPGTTMIVHCLVVPELWAGMQGDDWLNNASTRDTFGSYVENMLENDARRELAGVAGRCKERGIAYEAVMRLGEPADVVLAVATETGADLVVIGPPRRKGEEGLRSRMDLEKLVRGLKCPLLIAPRP